MFRPEVALHEPCRSVLLVLALSGALTSCDTESPSGGPTRETLPNGAVLVRYPTLPSSDSVGARVTEAQVDLKFGSIEGDDLNLIFGDVRGIQAAGDGTIYVLDQQAAEVRVFDSGGEYLRTIVRRGEGPGESWRRQRDTPLRRHPSVDPRHQKVDDHRSEPHG